MSGLSNYPIDPELVDDDLDTRSDKVAMISAKLERAQILQFNSPGKRKALLTFLESSVTLLEEERKFALQLVDKVQIKHEMDRDVTAILISKLMDHVQNASKEIMKMNKLLAELVLNWESLDKQDSDDEYPEEEFDLEDLDDPLNLNS